MLYKLPNPNLTQRTLDTPFSQRSPLHQRNLHQPSNHQINLNRYLHGKRKNFTQQTNSLSDQSKNFSISRQFNQNTINTSKNRSLPHQQQHSLNFNKKVHSNNFQSPNVTLELHNKTLPLKSISQGKPIKRSFSKKTEKIKFNKTSVYLQQVKQRRILQNYDQLEQVSLANLSQKFCSNQVKNQPKLNVEVCMQYFNMNDSTSFAHLARNHQLSLKKNVSVEDEKNIKKDKLFPKSNKYLDESVGMNKNGVQNDYYSSYLPINSQTVQLSKRYNFELKLRKAKKSETKVNLSNLNRPISISLKGDLSKKENNDSVIMPYLIRQNMAKKSRSGKLKKTQRVNFSKNRSTMVVLGNNSAQGIRFRSYNDQPHLNKKNLGQMEKDFTIVQNVPLNIIIQQEDLKNVEIENKEHGIEDYGFQQGPKTYAIRQSTKVFICKFCLEIYSVFEVRYHKGQVCNIAHKQTQFISKIKKVSSFLNQTFQSYYQSRPFYECFRYLAKKIQAKLENLQNEDNFLGLSTKIRAILNLKQNRNLLRGDKSSHRDRFMVQKIEELLHLEQFLKSQRVFEAVYEMIDLGNRNSIQGPIHKQTIIIVKHLFWLIRKLFEGLVLEKIKQIQL